MMQIIKHTDHTASIRDARITETIEHHKARYPGVTDRIRRGYPAERIAELVGCEVWVAKAVKFSGRW